MIYGMTTPKYAKEPRVPSYPSFDEAQDKLQRVSRLIGRRTNLDSRVRGNDEWRGNRAEGHLPFSFSVRERKLMNHFVVKYPYRPWLRLCRQWNSDESQNR